MKKKFSLMFLLGMFIIAGCSEDKEVLTGSIAGLVSDYINANQPIAGATVTLNSKGLAKTTGSDGRFEFGDLEPGSYTIEVLANGYQPDTKRIKVYAGQTTQCDFQLGVASTNVSIAPLNLVFGKNVEQLSFTILNNTNGALTYTVSNVPDFVDVVPAQGTVAAKGRQAVSVNVTDHSQNRNGQITVNVGSDSYTMSVSVSNTANTDPGNTDPEDDNPNNPTNPSQISVTRGLLAYYSFDDGKTATNIYDNRSYNGQLMGQPEFVVGSNGNGYGLRFRKGDYVSIPENMLQGKSVYTIGMWIKDFGQGNLFLTMTNNNINAPSIRISDSDKVQLAYDSQYNFGFNWSHSTFATSMTNYQSNVWHYLVIVKDASKKGTLYLNGILVDSQSVGENASDGATMTIGSASTDRMFVDNVRVHGAALTADEVSEIYNNEK
jgi:hypothetical protein